MSRLDARSALVTGAASGIGEAIARRYAAAGAAVCIADLDLGAAERVAKDIGGSAIAVRMDVTSESAVEAGVEEMVRRLGGVDVLVSNAGLQHVESIADVSFENWKRILAVHLDGGFLTTRACVRRMIASKRGGSVILMGSVHSKEASIHKGPYVAAKHGLLGLARTLAKEGGPHGIRANVICPGFVRTPLVERQIPQLARDRGITEEQVVKEVFLGTTVDGIFTTVDDVAEVALFLAAFPSAALTGQSIIVSHGWSMA